ncbi:MAG: ATP-binding cassette domain-containing protein [Salinivirgaceae bacterium]|nr:ATP-binding cassette domain-containing protein [Salinivirgaceae bacterium]
MISIDNITVSYGENNYVLKSLSLSIEEHEIHGIVGLNGSGKSTLLNTLYGLKKANSGKISINQHRLTKKEMAFLATENFFYSGITAREYLSLFNSPDYDIEQWNALFTLPLDDFIDGFSSGMKKSLH